MRLLGFDIGGTKCAVSLGEIGQGDARILGKTSFPTPRGWREALRQMTDAARALGGSPEACGVSCGGPLDAREGLILSPPNLPGWDGVPVTRLLSEATGLPAFLENDANACALAEWRYGAGRGAHDMVFLTFGTGLGAGVIMDDRLCRGANGNAGEAGHMRLSRFGPVGYGKVGSFEGFCSGGGLTQLAEAYARAARQQGAPCAYEGGEISARSVAEAARAGDQTAKRVFEDCARMLGEGLALLVDVLNPERIVLGSIFARCEDLLRPGMERALREEALPASLKVLSVVPAGLGEQIGDYAALGAADWGLRSR